MKEYKLCEINFEVGDIVRFKTDETNRPFKVLAIEPRVVDDSEHGNLHKLAFDVKDGDQLNPLVDIEVIDVGEEKGSWRDDVNDPKGWDADYFEKIGLDNIEQEIEWKEEDIVDDNKKLVRLNKIREHIVKSM